MIYIIGFLFALIMFICVSIAYFVGIFIWFCYKESKEESLYNEEE